MEKHDTKIIIEWRQNDQDAENKQYELFCNSDDPTLRQLFVHVPVGDGSHERSSRAKLIELMFQKAEEIHEKKHKEI